MCVSVGEASAAGGLGGRLRRMSVEAGRLCCYLKAVSMPVSQWAIQPRHKNEKVLAFQNRHTYD